MTLKKISCIEGRNAVKRSQNYKMSGGFIKAVYFIYIFIFYIYTVYIIYSNLNIYF